MPLKYNRFYGSVAEDIYAEKAQRYGWNYLMKGLFTFQHSLCAKEATGEGYSVWFIPWNKMKPDPNGGYKDTFFGKNYERIEEIWDVLHPSIAQEEIRVTFIKKFRLATGRDEYFFAGVYKPVQVREEKVNVNGVEVKRWIRIYEKISECYPIKRA